MSRQQLSSSDFERHLLAIRLQTVLLDFNLVRPWLNPDFRFGSGVFPAHRDLFAIDIHFRIGFVRFDDEDALFGFDFEDAARPQSEQPQHQ